MAPSKAVHGLPSALRGGLPPTEKPSPCPHRSLWGTWLCTCSVVLPDRRVHAQIPVPLAQCPGWTHPSPGTGHSLLRLWHMCTSLCILFTGFVVVVVGVGEVVVIYEKITSNFKHYPVNLCYNQPTNNNFSSCWKASQSKLLSQSLRKWSNKNIISRLTEYYFRKHLRSVYESEMISVLCAKLRPLLTWCWNVLSCTPVPSQAAAMGFTLWIWVVRFYY